MHGAAPPRSTATPALFPRLLLVDRSTELAKIIGTRNHGGAVYWSMADGRAIKLSSYQGSGRPHADKDVCVSVKKVGE